MIYQPSDDSYLLASALQRYVKNKYVLDMGSGSGILALESKKHGAKSVTAVDIDKESVENLKKQGIDAISSDLFEKIKNKFDVIIFNPPYLPDDKREDDESKRVTTGGKKGDEIILKFLKQAPAHMNENGIILLLVSSLTPQSRINKLFKKLGLVSEVVASKKIFFEELFVLKIEKA